jgi:hypothetical protein
VKLTLNKIVLALSATQQYSTVSWVLLATSWRLPLCPSCATSSDFMLLPFPAHPQNLFKTILPSRVLSCPHVHQVGSGSLSTLLTWHGSQPQLRPVLFISHIDVVPVTAETLQVRATTGHCCKHMSRGSGAGLHSCNVASSGLLCCF